jgi:hypothetical protein
VYLLPLGFFSVWLVAMLPTAFPLGWPRAHVISGTLYALLILIAPISTATLWYLSLSFFKRGNAWVKARPIWLWVIALVSPLCMLWGMGKRLYLIHLTSHGAGAALMPIGYWDHQVKTGGFGVIWSLLFLPLVMLIRYRNSEQF